MQTRTQLLATLKKKFKNHKTPAKNYADELLPNITKYIWSTEPQYYMELLALERGRIPKGRILKSEPSELYRCYKTGYDVNGNVLYEEYWGGHPSNGYTKFFVTEGSTTYSYTIERSGEFDKIEYLEYLNGKPYLYGCYSRHASKFSDTYFYGTDGTLNRIEMTLDGSFEMQETVYTIDYEALGSIEKITRIDPINSTFPKGQTFVIFKKASYSVKALTEIFTEEMLEVLTSAIEKSTHRFAMIAIEGAFSSDDWLPLKLHFSNGEKVLENDTLLENFINPDTVSYADINTPKLENAAQLLIQEATIQEKYDLPFKLLNDVTKKVKQNINNKEILLISADLYDDYNETVVSLLERIYSKKEVKSMLLQSNK